MACFSSTRRFHAAFLLVLLALIPSCSPKTAVREIQAHATIEWNPDPPVVGTNRLELSLADPAGNPLQLGAVQVEGNMNHAGMRPVFARLEPLEPGRYSGVIEFTMGGDWFLLLSSEPSAAGRLNIKVDVPGVKPK